jgi:hypothetical protein
MQRNGENITDYSGFSYTNGTLSIIIDNPNGLFSAIETPFVSEEEEQPQYLSSSLYQGIASSGAGLGKFIEYIALSLPILIIGILFVLIIVVMFKPLVKFIQEAIVP